MLANGAKLSYDKTNKGTSFTDLPGLKKIPDMGIEKEKVENSSLDDAVKVYEFGIGDPGDLEYTFKYDNSKPTSSYRLMRELEKTGATAMFKETLKDGTTTTFSGQALLKERAVVSMMLLNLLLQSHYSLNSLLLTQEKQ